MSVYVFWDNSNIWLVGKEVCKNMEEGKENDFRIHFTKLLEKVVGNRTVDFAFVAGSLPPDNDNLWSRFESIGANVETQERGGINGKEVAVDECIQLRMSKAIFDNLDSESQKTMILMTGDGNGYLESKGFIYYLEQAVKQGWKIEVVSWDEGCHNKLKSYAEEHGKYISLEPFYKKITFIKNGRNVKD